MTNTSPHENCKSTVMEILLAYRILNYFLFLDDWYKMAEILVEKMEVPALYLANKSVMALYGGGQMTGN